MCQVSDVPSGITGCNVNLITFIIYSCIVCVNGFFDSLYIMSDMYYFNQKIHPKSSLMYGIIDEL